VVAALLLCATAVPAAGQDGEPFIIDAFDLGFDPSEITVPAAGRYRYAIENSGALVHDLTFPDGTSTPAEPGEQSEPVEVDVPEGGLAYWCSIPGHREAGMQGFISVEGTASTPPRVIGVEPDPDVTPPEPYDATAPALETADEPEFSLTIRETPFTVAPGYRVIAWTFGGTVPGPTLRVSVGDRVTVRVSNAETNTSSHSVQFGAGQGPSTSGTIIPGEEETFTWTAPYAGVYLYSGAGSGTADSMLEDIANGLYGMIIVEPRGGLTDVASELVLVQGSWFVAGQARTTSLFKALTDRPDFVTFNGVAGQYLDPPIDVDVDETARFFLLNAGPSGVSSFHVQGAVFNRVALEGVELSPGNPGTWGSSAVSLAPGQGAIAETILPEAGQYPFYSNALDQAARGARGLIAAG
jgi:nitrite reductase (NO-forming)